MTSSDEDRSYKRQMLVDAARKAREESGSAPEGLLGSFHLTAAEVLERAALAIDLTGAPSDDAEAAWVVYRIARAYLDIPLVSVEAPPSRFSETFVRWAENAWHDAVDMLEDDPHGAGDATEMQEQLDDLTEVGKELGLDIDAEFPGVRRRVLDAITKVGQT